MHAKKRILCVDSDQENAALIQKTFSKEYEITICETGEACLEFLNNGKVVPDLILLEVSLQGINGFSVCQKIREIKNQLNNVPVLFVTEKTTLKDKLQGYSAGGDDYINKPYDIKLLKAKIDTNLHRYSDTTNLREELHDVTKAAINALIVTNELDVMVKFTNDSIEADSYQKLSDALFEVLERYHLSGSLQIRSKYGARNYSMKGSLTPLEHEIFKLYAYDEPVVNFSNKSVFSQKYISVLIKNMNLEDKNLYDRVLDHLLIITNYANARVKAIDTEETKNIQFKHLSTNVVETIKKDLKNLDEHFKGFEEDSKKVMDKLNLELDEILFSLALTEEQEAMLQKIITEAHLDLEKILDQEMEMDRYIDSITQHINNALDQDSDQEQKAS